MTSSGDFLPCRLEWRRSRLCVLLLVVLAAAAVAALWLSDLPRAACIAGSVLVAIDAVWLCVREARRRPFALAWAGGEAEWQLDGAGVATSWRHVGAHLRGGIAVLTLADARGRKRRIVWWPDTLDARDRRSLRLATTVPQVAIPAASAA